MAAARLQLSEPRPCDTLSAGPNRRQRGKKRPTRAIYARYRSPNRAIGYFSSMRVRRARSRNIAVAATGNNHVPSASPRLGPSIKTIRPPISEVRPEANEHPTQPKQAERKPRDTNPPRPLRYRQLSPQEQRRVRKPRHRTAERSQAREPDPYKRQPATTRNGMPTPMSTKRTSVGMIGIQLKNNRRALPPRIFARSLSGVNASNSSKRAACF